MKGSKRIDYIDRSGSYNNKDIIIECVFVCRCAREPGGVGGAVRASPRVAAADRALRGRAVRGRHRGRRCDLWVSVSIHLFIFLYM